ncbi:MAG: AAA family ATPase [Pseudorhodobacter sp. PARRP1]|nr:MAG: AAA family ATPase [Pseudorhodobacter sp. PARRP1]
MTRIPFIEARFFDPAETLPQLETRLHSHLSRLRWKRFEQGVVFDQDAAPDVDGEARAQDKEASAAEYGAVRAADRNKIYRRAKQLVARREASSGLAHLKKEDREKIEALRGGVRLVQIASEHRADELAALLHTEFPWLAPATEIVWHAMRRSVRSGAPGLCLPPLLLDGPPGIGKSVWARRLAEIIETPAMTYEATSENASFGIVGSQRAWGQSTPGRLIQTILRNLVGNPVVVVDEIEKAGAAASSKGQAFNLAESLLPLLEKATAKSWGCPYYEEKFDMAWVNWVLTSNDWRKLPEPLLSRCPPIHLRNLTASELQAFVKLQGVKRGLGIASIEAISETIGYLAAKSAPQSLRSVLRMIDRAENVEARPFVH